MRPLSKSNGAVLTALRGAGFVFDAADGVWHRPGARCVEYSEGAAAERDLHARIAGCRDRSVDSAELAAQIVDWPTEYHLSRLRANLVKPLAIMAGELVLELGAGCGAITRALGERGAAVVAVEGRRERARIAALRCADLPNVITVAADLADLPVLGADWVALIGVLEYAPVYGAPPDPVAALLGSAAAQLAHDGRLIVAIENALGLKYWAGCAEDHLGQRFYGVEGRYGDGEPCTWSRRRLCERLAAAGLPAQRLLLAFPDYKLPTALIDEKALRETDFDAGAFVALAVGRDYGGEHTRTLTEPLAALQLADAGLLAEMANSFLLLAARAERGTVDALDEAVLAWSYSADRRPGLATSTAIVRGPDGALTVTKRRDPEVSPPPGQRWCQRLASPTPYWAGRRLDLELMRAATRADPTAFDALLDRWIGALLADRVDDDGGSPRLPPEAVDRVPRNFVVMPDGRLVAFDQEWVSVGPVPLVWIVLRGLLLCLPVIVNGSGTRARSLLEVAGAALARHGVTVGDADVAGAVALEAEFISWVRGGPPEHHRWPESLLRAPLGGNVPSAFGASAAEAARVVAYVGELRAALDAERADHGRLIGVYRELEASAKALQAQLDETERFAREALAAREELARQFSHEREDHGRLIDVYRQLEAGAAQLRDQLASAEVLAQSTLQRLAVAEEQAVALQIANDELTARANSFETELRASEVLAQSTLQRLAVAEEQAVALQIANDELTARANSFETELRASEGQLARISQAWRLAEAEGHRLSGALRLAEAEAQRLSLALHAEQQAVGAAAVERGRLQNYLGVLGAELQRLQQTQASIGVRIGMELARQAARLAPAGTRRARLATLAGEFVVRVLADGPAAAVARTLAFLRLRRSRRAQLAGTEATSVVGAAGQGQGSRVDHPQLAAYIARCEPDADALDAGRRAIDGWTVRPLVSVIVPVYRLPREVLDATLRSIEEQTYPLWESCIVWADTEDDAGWQWLAERVAAEPRHRVRRLAANGGISRNSSAALETATGEFVALLDHDDTLAPWALQAMVARLQIDPGLDFLYSDKDSISADGSVRMNALFKPEWSPEMLHSVNYLTHLNLIRTAVLRDVGGWRPETDGAQDWDLFFRVSERTSRIARVAGILYHWRILPTSTASGLAAKPYAAGAQLRAQREHFQRRGLPAIVEPSAEGMFHVRWPGREARAVAVWQSGTAAELIRTLDLLRFSRLSHDATIDVAHAGAVTPDLAAFEQVWPERIRFHGGDSPGWPIALTGALERGAAASVLLLEGRCDGLDPEFAAELTGWTEAHPEISFCGALVLDGSTTVLEAGRVVNGDGDSAPLFAGAPLYSYGWLGGPLWYRNVSACSPYAVSIKVAALHAVAADPSRWRGGRDGFVGLCLALGGAGRGMVNPFARIRRLQVLEADWPNDGGRFHADPYFNPAFVAVSPLALAAG